MIRGWQWLYAVVGDWYVKARGEALDHMPTETGPTRVLDQFGEDLVNARNRGIRMCSCNS